MMLQYTAAALVLENQTLAAPDSVRSLPTSANQEDHNANSATAGRHLRRLVDNVRRIVAIELIAAAQAADLRLRTAPGARLGVGTAVAKSHIRSIVPFIEHDQLYGGYVEAVASMLMNWPDSN
jgi:histidine ammonia-lyase